MVVVELTAVKFCKVLEPLAENSLAVRLPTVAVLALRSVLEARPETYKFVVVASVPVAAVKVKD